MSHSLKRIFILIALAASLLGISGYFIFHKNYFLQPESVQTGIGFVQNSLVDSLGLVHSYPPQGGVLPQRPNYTPECLSESMGLWLWVLELTGRRKEFDQAVEVLKKYFFLPNGTLTWRVAIQDGVVTQDPESATIDDLRVIRALLEASERWRKPQYRSMAMDLAVAIKETAVHENYLLRDTLSMEERGGPFIVNVSYLDLKTMAMIAKIDPEWEPIHRRSLEILTKGMRPNGFIYDNYDVQEDRYYDNDRNMINYLLSAIYLAESGVSVEPFVQFVEKEWSTQGKIYGVYNPDTSKMEKDFYSVAVLGLSMRLAMLSGKQALAKDLKNHLLSLAAAQKYPSWKNALCDDRCHAFDHLQALVSFAAAGRTL